MSEHIPLDELSARIDEDALSQARLQQIDAHLAGCDDCRDQLASLRWAASFSRALPMAIPPASFALRLPSQAIESEPEQSIDSDFEQGPAWWRSGAWQGLAALAAMLILALMMGRLGHSSSDIASSGAPSAELYDAAESADEAIAEDFDAAPTLDASGALALVPTEGGGPNMDRAADHAQVRSEDAAEVAELIPPLATALGEDGNRKVQRAESEDGLADRPKGAATTATVDAELGGYSPPDRPIPGAAVARDRAPVAAAGATGTPSGQPEASLAMLSTPIPEPVDEVADAAADAAGSADAETDNEAEALAPEGAEAPAYPGANEAPEVMSSPGGGSFLQATEAAADGRSSLDDASVAEADLAAQTPTAGSTAPRSLLVPLAAISLGLLALATLLLRRAGQERNRRRHRQR